MPIKVRCTYWRELIIAAFMLFICTKLIQLQVQIRDVKINLSLLSTETDSIQSEIDTISLETSHSSDLSALEHSVSTIEDAVSEIKSVVDPINLIYVNSESAVTLLRMLTDAEVKLLRYHENPLNLSASDKAKPITLGQLLDRFNDLNSKLQETITSQNDTIGSLYDKVTKLFFSLLARCPDCNGTGKQLWSQECTRCGGYGVVKQSASR